MSTVKKIMKKSGNLSQLMIPLIAFALLVIFNLIRDPGFFSIETKLNNTGNTVLAGNLISIINGASELAILAMGMTLVTAACGGQDISVGAAAAIAGSVFVRIIRGAADVTGGTVILAFLACCVVAMLFGSFNGMLVSVFKIQPMIATLILYTCGRSIAYWINGGATPTISSPITSAIGSFIPGVPIPTPVIIVAVMFLLFVLAFRLTTLRLYTQTVGINQSAAKLNGINTTLIKLLSFILLGICVSVSGCIGVCRLQLINHETLLLDIEMDTILAVAIGGNSLGGGKFRIGGSVLGAYVIQMLTTTLYAMKVSSTDVKAYKAIVIVLLVVIGSPVVKRWFTRMMGNIRGANVRRVGAKEGA